MIVQELLSNLKEMLAAGATSDALIVVVADESNENAA